MLGSNLFSSASTNCASNEPSLVKLTLRRRLKYCANFFLAQYDAITSTLKIKMMGNAARIQLIKTLKIVEEAKEEAHHISSNGPVYSLVLRV